MAKEWWVNKSTGEERLFDENESFVMLRTTYGTEWKKGLTSSVFNVLMSLAEIMNKKGFFGLSKGARDKICKDDGITERTLMNAVRVLVKKNIIATDDEGLYMMNPEVMFLRPVTHISDYIEEYYAFKNKKNGR